MSRFSNHAIVYAQLIVGGKKIGLQPFLVQTRDKENFQVMPGIEMGDMGSKFGYESKDNGWLRFSNVRIPKNHMLSRFSRIDDEGNFEILGDLRVLYACMMMVRTHIVRYAGMCLMKALKVAIRYACVRRQFRTLEDDKKERKLIDYQTHMHKLGPLLARGFIIQVNGEIAARRQ
jgi:acyl-CoA oxidase